MKKILVVALFSIYLAANHVNWMGNYNKALIKANKESKPMLVLLIKNNSQECKDVVKNIFTNKKYIDKINNKYISVIINYDTQDYPIELFYSTIFPTLFFVDSKTETFIKEPLYSKNIVEQIVSKLF